MIIAFLSFLVSITCLVLFFIEKKSAKNVTVYKEVTNSNVTEIPYSQQSVAQKGRLYFDYRVERYLKSEYPKMLTWSYTHKCVSVLDQKICVLIHFKDETQKKWLKMENILGSFKLEPDIFSKKEQDYTDVPASLKTWYYDNRDAIDEKIAFAIRNRIRRLSYSCSEIPESERQLLKELLNEVFEGCIISIEKDDIIINTQYLIQ